MDFLHALLDKGAPISYVLLIGFLVATFLFFHRLFYLNRVNIDSESFLLGLRNNLRKFNEAKAIEAIAICDEIKSPVASIARAILSRNSRNAEDLKEAANETAALEIPRLQRNARLIAAIGQIAPFLGLLGTVLRLMENYKEISEKQAGFSLNVVQMSGNLQGALITTAMGIVLSVVIILYNVILLERCHNVVYDMEKVSGELIAFLSGGEGTDEQMNKELASQKKQKA